jgi:hypothetical protein
VKVEASGFATSIRSIALQVQQTAQTDFSLTIGASTQTVEVVGTIQQINSTDATVGTVIENKQITDLPLNGRDFLQLISLSAAVTTGFGSPGQAQARQGGSRATENYSIMGLRGTSNYYSLDGVSNTDVNFNLIIMQPSIDAVQEFKVQSGVYPAQFGRQAAQINSATKSGTNQFHGAAFEFLRNDVMDAKQYDFVGTKPPKNPFKWNQFGFTLGGPVWIPKVFDGHNKLFFLSNYEGFRLRQSNNGLFTVPTQLMRSGNFANLLPGNQLYDPTTKKLVNGVASGTPFTGNIIPHIDPISTKLMAYMPLPNIQTSALNNNYETTLASPQNRDQFTQRVDFTQSDRTSWFGRFTWTSENQLAQGIYLNGSTVDTKGYQAVLGNTHIFSQSKVNDVRFGWNLFKNVSGTELAGVTDVVGSLGIPGLSTPDPLSWGIPSVGGFTNGLSGWGNATSAPFVLNDETFQIVDNFSWTLGRHVLQLGVDLRDDHYNYYGNEFSRGQFLFTGTMTRSPFATSGGDAFADFLTGYCSTCADATSLAFTQFRAKSQAYYVDDSWRATQKLSLSLGLRYEFIPPWRDKSQNVVNTILPGAIPNVCCVTDLSVAPTLFRAGTGDFYQGHENVRYSSPIQVAREDLYGGRLIQSDKTNVAPRIGVIYSPTPAWSVRAGFGIFYSQDSGIEYFDMARGWGRVNAQGNPNQPNVNYNNFIGANGSYITLVQPNVYGIDPKLKNPYVIQYVFNIQHDLSPSTILELNYSGGGGHHLDGLMNLNPAIPGTTGNASSRAPFNYLGIIQIMQSRNYSNYNSASIKATRRTSAGLTYIGSYTFSKALDNGSAIRGTSTDILPQNSRCLPCDYGYSSFDVPHRFVASAQYELPFGKGKHFMNTGGFLNVVFGGWQVGSIVQWQSGLALNTTGADQAGTGGYGEIRLNGTGISPNLPSSQRTLKRWYNTAAFALPTLGTFGNLPRNSLRGPSFINWDASAIKNFHIHESKSLEFRFETFNTANHANWGNPNSNWSNGSNPAAPGAAFTSITTTAHAMRQMQVALKFVF